jgi:hypothetical protein
MQQITKSVKAKKPKINNLKYSALWQATLFPLFQEVMMNE